MYTSLQGVRPAARMAYRSQGMYMTRGGHQPHAMVDAPGGHLHPPPALMWQRIHWRALVSGSTTWNQD